MGTLDLARKAILEIKARRNGMTATSLPGNRPFGRTNSHGSLGEEAPDSQVRPATACNDQSVDPGIQALDPQVDRTYDLNDKNDRSHLEGAGTGYVLVEDRDGLGVVEAALDAVERVALDLETTGLDPRSDRVRLLSLGMSACDGGTSIFLVDCFEVDPASLWKRLAQKELVIHNATFDLGFLSQLGFLAGKVRDTMLLSQLLAAGTKDRSSLAACCDRHLGRTIDKTEQTGEWSGGLTAAQLEYAAIDVEVLEPLVDILDAKFRQAGLEKVAEIEMRCLPATVWMARQGIGIDRAAWEKLAQAATLETDRIHQELQAFAPPKPGKPGDVWNWNSPNQVLQALRLVACELKNTKDETLASTDHPLAWLLRRYRQSQKLSSTYGTNWLANVAEEGRVYPKWNQLGAVTGRMSSAEPNMQQVPRGQHRRSIIAPPGRVLIKGDFSQIELRIAAKISGDKALLDAYRRGDDLHSITARNVLGIEKVTKEDRQLAKALNFGLLFGMGPEGFSRYAKANYGLNLSIDDARRYRNAFFESYPGLAEWHRRVRLRKSMETRTLSGRRRILDARTPDTERLNTPVQGTGADGLKRALALLWERRDQAPGAFPVLVAHDEIVVEADADPAEAISEWLRSAMVDGMAPLIAPVPVEVELSIARTWGKEEA